ncbi:hypothetical protein MJO28_011885 [Puccinia striiformis f. sp. tritici]|uniref:Uncharacterized protein n=2 Tax=Puccinia striiformis f. sp. tritici TaxID=168172 RepID=A0ACC0E3V9_9BASI|nr:hypothetical protein Pst134EA_021456 [Puccinia striiformis f. sp. tritici]KAH9457583.1 hypothetical protein Pst134EA_021456 [Puccinia striiformis f. sp. tritici]KAI7944357.1 hypothetical protein MJO28_011885 [Puccinia striiformis f. sp. tritici]
MHLACCRWSPLLAGLLIRDLAATTLRMATIKGPSLQDSNLGGLRAADIARQFADLSVSSNEGALTHSGSQQKNAGNGLLQSANELLCSRINKSEQPLQTQHFTAAGSPRRDISDEKGNANREFFANTEQLVTGRHNPIEEGSPPLVEESLHTSSELDVEHAPTKVLNSHRTFEMPLSLTPETDHRPSTSSGSAAMTSGTSPQTDEDNFILRTANDVLDNFIQNPELYLQAQQKEDHMIHDYPKKVREFLSGEHNLKEGTPQTALGKKSQQALVDFSQILDQILSTRIGRLLTSDDHEKLQADQILQTAGLQSDFHKIAKKVAHISEKILHETGEAGVFHQEPMATFGNFIAKFYHAFFDSLAKRRERGKMIADQQHGLQVQLASSGDAIREVRKRLDNDWIHDMITDESHPGNSESHLDDSESYYSDFDELSDADSDLDGSHFMDIDWPHI